MDKTPKIIDNLIKEDEFLKLQTYFKANYKNYHWQNREGRYINDSMNLPILKDFLYSSLDIVRKTLGNDKILPTIGFFAHYETNAIVTKHKDSYGGTHTLDVPLYQTEPWDIYVENTPYTLKENQALFFWGEEQNHSRKRLEKPNAHVAVLLCHYAEPSHYRHQSQDLKT
jgi:hypothetical protein